MVFPHGGGFVFGDLDTHDRTCRRIAAACDVDVLAVDYRLAPSIRTRPPWRTPSPSLTRARPAAVAGDSAGGFLAAAACLALRDAGGPLPALQALICPNTDLTLSRPSITEKGTEYDLDVDVLAFFVASYVPEPRESAARGGSRGRAARTDRHRGT